MGWILLAAAAAAILAAKRVEKAVTAAIDRKTFVATIAPIAQRIQAEFGLNARIMTIQAALESNWGASRLAIDAQNLFGMTADAYKKQMLDLIAKNASPDIIAQAEKDRPYKEFVTNEYSEFSPEKIKYWSFPGDVVEKRAAPTGGTYLKVRRPFRAYANWYESARDWARKLTLDPRYSAAVEAAKAGDVNLFAFEIKRSGYATNPNYAAELKAINGSTLLA